MDEDTAHIFENAVQRFYHTRREHTLTAAYNLMLKEYYTDAETSPDGETRLVLKPQDEIPTLRQFRYWYQKTYDESVKLRARKGEGAFELNHRAILGKSNANIVGPGSQYQIDATVGDIYLVSRFKRANIIGRPVIYFVMDTFSRMVTGIYVGLEGPSWAGAMMALCNAASDKVAYCAEYGIEITESQWPCRHIPDVILADRGEMEGKSVETLINALNIRVDNAPPYRADMKGIIEQHFRTINKENGIKQDFYASLWAANLTNAAIADAMPATVQKLKHKANRRNAVKRAYRRLFALLFSRLERCRRIWNAIRNRIKKSLSAVRPGRRFDRSPHSASHSCVHARACLS